MNADKLKQIIQRQNEQREEDAKREAERLIEEIVELTNHIEETNKAIAERRTRLKELEVQVINPDAVLGKE